MLLRFTRNRKVVLMGGFSGAVGAMAVWQRKRRRPPQAATAQPDPAQELRSRLDESRAVAAEQPTPAAAPQPSPDADPATRRQSVHEDARARLDDLKGADTGE